MATSDPSTIAVRSNGEEIRASWFNAIRNYLIITDTGLIPQNTFTLDNNSTVALTDFLFDAAAFTRATIHFFISRVSDTNAAVYQGGKVEIIWNGTTWLIAEGPNIGTDSETVLSITENDPLGQLYYTTNNYDPTGYIGRIDLLSTGFIL